MKQAQLRQGAEKLYKVDKIILTLELVCIVFGDRTYQYWPQNYLEVKHSRHYHETPSQCDQPEKYHCLPIQSGKANPRDHQLWQSGGRQAIFSIESDMRLPSTGKCDKHEASMT